MSKPYGRKTKKKVSKILTDDNRSQALSQLEKIPNEQLVGHLFSHFYHKDELIKFRSVTAMGELACRIADHHFEKARVILRRIMWNLNDESGGIGWGSPEAMGEILSQNKNLALEFKSILFSYLDNKGNFIEHEMLQRGVLWGIGTYLESMPEDLTEHTRGLISGFLHSADPVKRAYAVRALVNADCFDCSIVPEVLLSDNTEVPIYNGWHYVLVVINDMSHTCTPERQFA